ncbi:Bacillibactin transport regulator [Thiorhodovibrio winogradskyi]|uniref:Bacillibactin transport regulator n=1 Tax=Thiorhodovibrio winogradskyi TaxID=77007 RepID=A0ABZ0S9H9_9GAMM|nr:AraC family transcriptional regulator [Thiorhodovibrio winogradskyi]
MRYFESMLNEYRTVFLQDAAFHAVDGAGLLTPGPRHERIGVAATGYLEHLMFDNGLLAGRCDYRLERAHQATFCHLETFLGASPLVEGEFDLAIPDLHFLERIRADRIWVRAGRVDAMHYAQPARQFMRGVSIDVSDSLLGHWREQAPQALSQALRAVLEDSRPTLKPFSGRWNDLRALALRFLAVDTSTLCGRLQFESLALDLLARLLGAEGDIRLTRTERRERRLHTALDDARAILDSDLTASPTIAELARRVGLNECYLKAGFRQRFGHTIGAYVRLRRMEQARELLERGGYGVQEAALAVGFSNLGWFSSIFKSQFGCLPSTLVRPRRR